MDRHELLKVLEEEAKQCQNCALYHDRKNVVFGTGPDRPAILFVGEAPGRIEDERGVPFVGAAGELFDKILEAAEIRRKDVYITNIVKCRPRNNRTPNPDEVAACRSYLDAQIALLQPPLVVALGRPAACTLLDVNMPIGKLRGSWRKKDGLLIFPTYHPAALLRQKQLKRATWEDFQKIGAAYQKVRNLKDY